MNAYLLGSLEFEAALALQQRLVYECGGRRDGQISLLICEHPKSISVGRHGSRLEIRLSERTLVSRQLAVRWVIAAAARWCTAQDNWPYIRLVAVGVSPLERRRIPRTAPIRHRRRTGRARLSWATARRPPRPLGADWPDRGAWGGGEKLDDLLRRLHQRISAASTTFDRLQRPAIAR